MKFIVHSILEATAWPMNKPGPYSPFHLFFLAAGIPTVFFAARMAANQNSGPGSNNRSQIRLLFCCGLVLACSEIYKQLFLYWIVNGGCYDWWYFPFQLCSVPMYLCLLLPVFPKKLQRLFCTFIQDFGLLGGVMALLEPSGLMHPYWSLTLHGFLWHFLLIFMGLYCAFTGLAYQEKQDFLRITPLFLICCAIAHIINVASHPFGNADMFYISPYYPNGQVVFHQIALKTGVAAGNLIYLTGVLSGGLLVHILLGYIRRPQVS